MKYLSRTLVRPAERRIHSAAAVCGLLGFLSLWVALGTWRERRHPDFEVLLGTIDALAVLALAWALSRRIQVAAWILLALAVLGAAYTLWRGSPVFAILPQAVSAVLLVRAIRAFDVLRAAGRDGRRLPSRAASR